jgi:hypothetical protein
MVFRRNGAAVKIYLNKRVLLVFLQIYTFSIIKLKPAGKPEMYL